jgi:hypothetical protein
MFKLLVESDKKKMQREYLVRRIAVALFALDVVIFLAIVGLFPAYLLSTVRLKNAAERSQALGYLGKSDEGKEARDWFHRTNQELAMLEPSGEPIQASADIKNLLGSKNAGVRLTNLVWKKSAAETTLAANGIASDRQSLISFEKKINESKLFSSVTLPVSNLAKDRQIDFSLKLTPIRP